MIFNEHIKLRQGGRKAVVGGREALEQFNTSDYHDYNEITEYPKVEKDIAKYQFDLENLDCLGIRTTKSGVDFLVFDGGGDWEYPLYFFVYYDGNDLRGYVPTRGNAVNTLTKAAFGNGEDIEVNGENGDTVYCNKYGIPVDEDGYFDDIDLVDEMKDLDACIEEFENRIEVVENAKPSAFKRKTKETENPENTEQQEVQKTWDDCRRIQLFIGGIRWDLVKRNGHWFFIVTQNENQWCIDSDFTYDAINILSRCLWNFDKETFGSAKIYVRAGYAQFVLCNGKEISDTEADKIINAVTNGLKEWQRFDASPLLDKIGDGRLVTLCE